MRVLAFSDFHGDATLIERLRQESKDCDLILCCGDITPAHGSTVETGRRIGGLGARVLAVPGNFELPNDMRVVCKEIGWIDLHGKSFEIGGITFSGCGGGNTGPFRTPYELSEQEFGDILAKVSVPEGFVLVTHCPPMGALDEPRKRLHIGSQAIKEFVEKNKPVMQFCGHIHECGGREETLGRTKVVNVAKQIRIVEIG